MRRMTLYAVFETEFGGDVIANLFQITLRGRRQRNPDAHGSARILLLEAIEDRVGIPPAFTPGLGFRLLQALSKMLPALALTEARYDQRLNALRTPRRHLGARPSFQISGEIDGSHHTSMAESCALFSPCYSTVRRDYSAGGETG